MKKIAATAFATAIAAMLGSMTVSAQTQGKQQFDPYSQGARAGEKFDPYSQGAKSGDKFDPYTQGTNQSTRTDLAPAEKAAKQPGEAKTQKKSGASKPAN
ncbi:amino acid ABC transporter permease [Cupriavidus sp. AU9028]|uniref:amino acid ABC transporter permease n=1 Tax=Cupriavidus sp. AU9028 TaxID=2871157 RepID=UPI001C953AEA|nr:amino acid ABC transporter permease [Cupriavidus sp. AU9028]MBY4897853.1 amino acid ABC transporter permease [Cupriavidus sp. AU9028]